MTGKFSKANAIRLVGQNKLLTNAEVKCMVEKRFGLSVTSGYIVDVLGAFRDRVRDCHKSLIDAGTVFLNQCGNRRNALKILRLVRGVGETLAPK
jgi:hypothetical protein